MLPFFTFANKFVANSSPNAPIKASFADFVWSLTSVPNSLIASKALSENTPLFAESIETAKNSSIPIPASLN